MFDCLEVGNRRFRIVIDNNLETYIEARTKHEKSLVVTVIVDSVRDCTTRAGGGFVRKDLLTRRWYEVGDKIGREKVGHALRDAIKLKAKEAENHRKDSPSSSSCEPKPKPKPSAKRRRTGDTRTSKAPDKQAEVSSDTDKFNESKAEMVLTVAKASSKSPTDESEDHVRKLIASLREKKKKQPRYRKEKEYQEVVNVSGLVEDDWELSLKESDKQFCEAEEGFDENEDEAEDVALDDARNATAVSASSKSKWQPPVGFSREGIFRLFPESKQPLLQDPPPTEAREKLHQWNPPNAASMDNLYKQMMRAKTQVQDQHIKEDSISPWKAPSIEENFFQQVMQGATTSGSSSMFQLPTQTVPSQSPQYGDSSRYIEDTWAHPTCDNNLAEEMYQSAIREMQLYSKANALSAQEKQSSCTSKMPAKSGVMG